MKYLISGIIGFFLTLALSLPFQNVIKPKEAKAFAAAVKNKMDGKSIGVVSVAAAAGAALADKNLEMDIKVQPIVRIEEKKDEPRIKFFPQYPAEAAAQKIEGYVTVTFRVSKDGTVQNLKVTESSPPQIFDEAALTAVSKWSFASVDKDQTKVVDRQKLRLNFSLGRTVAEQRLTESGF